MLLRDCSAGHRSGSYSQNTLIPPCKLDCGIPAADGLDNSFLIDISLSREVTLLVKESS